MFEFVSRFGLYRYMYVGSRALPLSFESHAGHEPMYISLMLYIFFSFFELKAEPDFCSSLMSSTNRCQCLVATNYNPPIPPFH